MQKMSVKYVSVIHGSVSAMHFFMLHVSIVCCDQNILMVWLGKGTKTTWLGLLRIDHVFSYATRTLKLLYRIFLHQTWISLIVM